jgi:hypothetical protein
MLNIVTEQVPGQNTQDWYFNHIQIDVNSFMKKFFGPGLEGDMYFYTQYTNGLPRQKIPRDLHEVCCKLLYSNEVHPTAWIENSNDTPPDVTDLL